MNLLIERCLVKIDEFFLGIIKVDFEAKTAGSSASVIPGPLLGCSSFF